VHEGVESRNCFSPRQIAAEIERGANLRRDGQPSGVRDLVLSQHLISHDQAALSAGTLGNEFDWDVVVNPLRTVQC
jgi:hypothetical protein